MAQRFRLFPGSPRLNEVFSRRAMRYRWRDGGPVITSAILAICVVVWVVEALFAVFWRQGLDAMLSFGVFRPSDAIARPWTFVTSMFLHDPHSILHILFNMLTLWAVGPVLERMMGHWPFLTLYMLSGIAGGVGMMVWAAFVPQGAGWIVAMLTSSYGASGALFGLFAAILVVYRHVGADITSMLIWMAINFATPLIVPNIAWQAHVGGFLVGALFTWLLVSGVHALRGKSMAVRTAVYAVAVFAVMLVVMAVCVHSGVGVWSTALA